MAASGTGPVALVTGAAGGIGAAVVRALAGAGSTVAACDRDADALAAVVAAQVAAGLPVHAFALDVGSSTAVEAVVEQIEGRLGPIAQLVNCAGILRLGRARELSDRDWTETFEVNATGVFHVSRAVVNRMVPRRSGAIVSVASNAASTARVDMAAYAASKAAVAMFTKCLGLEVAGFGIRCNVVAPGSTATPMLTSLWHDGQGPQSSVDGTPEEFRLGIPLGKVADPVDIADSVAFLLSDRAGHITMETLTVDGGATLGS
jgi:2,3-dihydro-2,3-dihydroxybenzoate dehydrogenase